MYSSRGLQFSTRNINENPPSLDTTYLGGKNIPNDCKEGFIIKIPKEETSACVKNASINTLKGTQPHTG